MEYCLSSFNLQKAILFSEKTLELSVLATYENMSNTQILHL